MMQHCMAIMGKIGANELNFAYTNFTFYWELIC